MTESRVCPRCGREAQPGEEWHPTTEPFHVQCQVHHQCYVLCADQNHDDAPTERSRVEPTSRQTD